MSKMKTIRPISVSYFLVLKTTLLQLLLLSTATFANSVEGTYTKNEKINVLNYEIMIA